ncbi:MAG TPA: MoaD/ThiS family protein [Candidatus Limnocylindria bacterium]|nr:MoaD/ThiS family protein [Candidatus Limnocylindria bacterium]
MSVTLRLASPLRPFAGGSPTLPVDATDLASLRTELADRHPDLAARILQDGRFGPFVSVFIDGEDARYLPDDADLRGARVVELLPAVSGG